MLTPVNISWAPFEPDKGPYAQNATDATKNVHPTALGYKPLPSFNGTGTALAAAPLGAITVRKAAGTTDIYAFTATKAYKQDGADGTWDEVTRGIGTVVDDYATTTHWSLAQYGTYLVACNSADETQFIDVDSGTEFDDLPNAPQGQYVTVMGERILIGKLSTDARAIAWSGPNDADYWTYGFRGSDTRTFVDGGKVQGVIGINSDALVFQDDKIRVLRYVGGNLVYQISTLHENLGCFAPRSIVAARGVPYWYAEQGFFAGFDARPIGAERVNEWVKTEAGAGNLTGIQGAADPTENMIWWRIPKEDGTSFLLGYDFILDKWARLLEDVKMIFTAIPQGVSIDGLGSTGLGFTMDTIPYPFDSPIFQGSGIQDVAAFSTINKFGYFAGAPLEACLETNDIEFNPGAHAFLQSARVVCDASYANVTVAAGRRNWHGETITWGTGVTPSSSTGVAWLRSRAKLHRLRTVIAAETDWTQANGMTAYIRQAGSR